MNIMSMSDVTHGHKMQNGDRVAGVSTVSYALYRVSIIPLVIGSNVYLYVKQHNEHITYSTLRF